MVRKNSSKGSKPCSRYNTLIDSTLQSVLKKLGRDMGSMTKLQPQYQYARIAIEGGTWRIQWYNMHPVTGVLTRVRSTMNLNRIKALPERQRVAGEYVKIVNDALTAGYNYFIDKAGLHFPDITQPVKAVGTEAETVTLAHGLQKALRIRVLGKSDRTQSSYNSYLTTFMSYLAAQQQAAMPADAYTTEHYYQYIFYKENKGHGNKNLNQTTFFLRSLFELMAGKLKLIPANPLAGIEPLPEEESKKFMPLTPEEIERIVPALIAYNPRYYLFCRFVPDEYIRPHHIARLKAGDISYSQDTITLGGDTTKSKRIATKQLLKGLKEMLLQMEYNKVPGNYYLFTGAGFTPGPALYPRLSITAAEVWRQLVIEGLGINKQLYALKHTSAQYFVNNNPNVDVYYLRQQLEHASARETEIYLQKNIRKKVKDSDVNTLKF